MIRMNKLILLNVFIPWSIKIIIPDGRYGIITIFTDLIILPFILLLLNILFFLRGIEHSILKVSFYMSSGLILGDITGYIIWGISSKKLFNPDYVTFGIIQRLLIYHIFFVATTCFIIKCGKFFYDLFQK